MWNMTKISPGMAGSLCSRFRGTYLRRKCKFFRALLLVGAAAVPLPSFAAVFAPSFAGPSLDSSLAATGSPGTSFTVGGGTLALDQAAGVGDGDIFVTLTSPVSGDFIASVVASGASGVGLGRADLGLEIGSPGWTDTLADVFLNDNAGGVIGNIFQPTVSGQFQPKSTDTLILTIARSGNTVTESYDAGSGSIVVNSATDPSLSGPIEIGVFLLEVAGDTAEHYGTFSDFRVASGDDLAPMSVPEPATAGLMVSGVMALCGVSAIKRRKVGSVR
jgi:hypothetical protein